MRFPYSGWKGPFGSSVRVLPNQHSLPCRTHICGCVAPRRVERMSVDARRGGEPPAVMQRLAKGLLGRSTMRYNPFRLFESKLVGIQEEWHSDENAAASAVSAASVGSTPPPVVGKIPIVYNLTKYTYVASRGVAEADSGTTAPSTVEVVLKLRRQASGACPTTPHDITVALRDNVDTTGNFHWPAEEVLAHLLLNSSTPPMNLLELGAGTGLAGLCYAARNPTARVCLTDGNAAVVALLAENIARNAPALENSKGEGVEQGHVGDAARSGGRKVRALHLLWHDPDAAMDVQVVPSAPTVGAAAAASSEGRSTNSRPISLDAVLAMTDTVVGADCLFFDRYHTDLVALLLRYIGLRAAASLPAAVWLVAPRRGKTLGCFVEQFQRATSGRTDISLVVQEQFDPVVTAVHVRELEGARTTASSYDVDKHQPWLVRIVASV